MVRIAKQTDPKKLEELRVKIHESNYLQLAIDRIAIKLSNEIVNRNGYKNENK